MCVETTVCSTHRVGSSPLEKPTNIHPEIPTLWVVTIVGSDHCVDSSVEKPVNGQSESVGSSDSGWRRVCG